MSWDKKKQGGQDDDKNVVYNDDVEYDEIDDLNEDLLHLHNWLGDSINNANNKLQYIEKVEILNEDKGQRKYFNNVNNVPLANNISLAQNEHFGGANNNDGNDDDNNDNDNKNQNHDKNNHNQVSEDDGGSTESYDDYNNSDDESEDNHEDNHYPEDEEDDDDNIAEPEDDDQDTNDIDQLEDVTGQVRKRNRRSMRCSLPSANSRDDLNGSHWRVLNSHICPILGVIVVAEQTGVQMMKENFEIEASKSTP